MSEEPSRVVRIEPTCDAPAEDVFDAWTTPEVMRRWFHCGSDWGTPEADVELSFSESDGSTTVLMVNSRISTDERHDAQDEGWHGCLDQLERILAG